MLPGILLLLLLALSLRRLCRVVAARRRRLSLIYLRTLLGNGRGGRSLYGFPFIDRRGGRLALCEAVALLRRMACDCDPPFLRSVVRTYDLDSLLLKRLRYPFGRNRTLWLLASIPLGRRSAEELACYTDRGSRPERFALLLARMNADPSHAGELLDAFDEPLTLFECREVMALLLRGSLPLPYLQLLASDRENQQRLGLCIVRHFSLRTALGRVRELLEDPKVGHEALQLLCALGEPLSDRAAVAARKMAPEKRRSLLRRAAQRGYALQGVEQLLSGEERLYFERLAASYKSAELWS